MGQPYTQPVAAPADFKVNNRAGFNAGDILVAAENIAGVPTCTLEEVTQTPTTVGQTDMLIHNTGSYTNPHGQSIVSRFNKVGGLGVVHTSGTLYDLGPQPRSNSYQIEGGNHLTVIDQLHFFDGNADGVNDSVELSDEVIDLQAQYGVDANNDGVVDPGEFQDAAPANWALLRAIRLAVLVRSPNWERDQVTTVAPSWSGGNFVMSNPDANTVWQNYRYRVYETVVPLRNMIWGQ